MPWINAYTNKNRPDPRKPLEVPKTEIIGDFYVLLGTTVSTWQLVEHSLIKIYARIINAKNYKALAASFHIPTSFRTRLDLVDAAIKQVSLPEEYSAKWEKIYKSAKAKSKRRNEVAHSIVIFDPSNKPAKQLFLAKNINNPTKFKSILEQSAIISSRNLKDLRIGFEKLHKEIVEFDLSLLEAGFK